jgi:parallel beta-helix repeat protein
MPAKDFLILLYRYILMAITHAAVKTDKERGYASEWNAPHAVDDASRPKNNTTLIVAASDSLDTTRADYVCDGIDDQEQINAAIAALPAGGGRISLLEGTYQLTGSVDVTTDGVTIFGLGHSTVLQSTTNHAVIEINNSDNCNIQSLRIIGTGAGNGANRGVYLNVASGCTISDLWIDSCGNAGIYLTQSNRNVIYSVLCDDNVLAGIYMGDSDFNSLVSTNTTGGGAVNRGLVLATCEYNRIIGHYSDGNLSGISLGANSHNNNFTSCVSINNNQEGILIGGGCTYNNVNNSQTNANGQVGIQMNAGADNNNVISNVATGNGAFQIRDLGANNDVAHNQVV